MNPSTSHSRGPDQYRAESAAAAPPPRVSTGLLGWVERTGNRLPDLITLFIILAGIVLIGSWVSSAAGLSTTHPNTGKTVHVYNLLSRDGMQWIFRNIVQNFTSFTPLGVVLVAMIGIGVAERTGLFTALLKAIVMAVPARAITPTVVFAGLMSHMAADAGYVILPPLAAMLYASLGRHPLAGIAAVFAGISGGFSANLLLSALDPLLAGITQDAARLLDSKYAVNAACNWYFMASSVGFLTLLGWWVTARIIEPRLGAWDAASAPPGATVELGALGRRERAGLLAAGAVFLASVAAIALMIVPKDGILRDPAAATPVETYKPFFESLVGLILIVFLLPGLAYGLVMGGIRNDRDAVRMTSQTIATMSHYIVMAFFAGQFIKWFDKSQLGLILAVKGAGVLQAIELTGPLLLVGFITCAALFNILISSASAKWMILAPIFVPMFMVVGQSPETTQAMYRIGDSCTNVITPLNVYFPLLVAAAQRYVTGFGLGSLLALMIPYSLAFFVVWSALAAFWYMAGLPMGPGAPLHYVPGG